MTVNSMYFSEEAAANGDLAKFVNMLNGLSYNKSGSYNDIHIYPADCGAFSVEWVQLPWNHEWGGEFKYVEEEDYTND